MQFIHAREHLKSGDVVIVNSDTQANVMITTDTEFAKFKRGAAYSYYGGLRKRFPTEIVVPHTGYWNTTIDVGEGYKANIKYSISYQKQT